MNNVAELVASSSHPKHSVPIDGLCASLNHALRGKPEVIEFVLACLLARGHLLLEDLPGLGKTTLAKALAAAMGGTFARVQCTPDLLPGDITGFTSSMKTPKFEFQPGPVFADVCWRMKSIAPPRTQVHCWKRWPSGNDGRQHSPSARRPFRNRHPKPDRTPGTYPFPSTLDRFAMASIGYGTGRRMDLLASAVGAPTASEDGYWKGRVDRLASRWPVSS